MARKILRFKEQNSEKFAYEKERIQEWQHRNRMSHIRLNMFVFV